MDETLCDIATHSVYSYIIAGFLGSDKLALAVTLVIGCAYCIGFAELLQFRAATASLTTALTDMPEQAEESTATLQPTTCLCHCEELP